MNVTEEHHEVYATKGERLAHLLDHIGFKSGHGRMAYLQQYIRSKLPEEFKDLKYDTVKAWFIDNAPAINKIEKIIDLLQVEYNFQAELAEVKTWWKLGGKYPFTVIEKIDKKNENTHLIGMSKAISADPIRVSQVILKIEKTRKEINLHLSKEQTEIINSRIVMFSQKNSLDAKSEVLHDAIVRMLSLAKDGII